MTQPLFRFVALGDSTGVGVGAGDDGGYPERLYRRLKGQGLNAGILNLAQSGATTADVLQSQARRAADKRPSLVTLGIGTNDLWRMTSENVFSSNLNAIADILAPSAARVVVCNLIDLAVAPAAKAAQAWLGVTPAVITARVHAFNAQIALLGKRPGFEVVDLYTASRAELAKNPDYFCPDGFHPSTRGYDRWAELCWPAVWRAAEVWQQQGLPAPAVASTGT